MDLVVANYNNGRFLQALVDSVRAQTLDDWHLYIVDDCSTDDSAAYFVPFAEDDRITVIQLTQNGGATHAFKVGIEAGQADLIGLIGADDALEPRAVERMSVPFENDPELACAYSECMDCDANLKPLSKRDHAQPLDPNQSVFEQLYSIFNFIVFSRAAYEQTDGLDGSLRRAMDHDLILRLEEVGTFAFVPEVLYRYRTHDGGISQGGNWMLAELYSLLARINAYERRKKKPISADAFRALQLKFHRRSLFLQTRLTDESLTQHALAAIRLQPLVIFQRGFLRDCLKIARARHAAHD